MRQLFRAVAGLAMFGSPVVVAAQQATTISGRVTSTGDVPVQAASVAIPALGVGALTNEQGRYTFTVPAARATGQTVTLTARRIGFRISNRPGVVLNGTPVTADFTLDAAVTQLEGVVVTGAGTETRRERLGNVVNSVDSSLIRRASEPQNVVSALTAKAPNVEIRTQSGEPGASASIKIRGATSVTGTNQPLFVVDGQPIDNQTNSVNGGNQSTVTQNRAADINPNDIQSVEILKGAAAAAIYGARAANGVVLITTKSGRAGPTRYTLQSTATVDDAQPNISLQRSYALGTRGITATCNTADCRPSVPSRGAPNVAWGARLDPSVPTYNHLEEIYDTGVTTDNVLSASGGNERTTFYLSGGLTRQDGVIVGPNNDYTRTTVRLKGTHQLIPRMIIGGNFSYIDTEGSYVQKGSNVSGLLLGALRTPPEFNNEQYLDTLSGLHRSYRFRNPTEASLQTGRGYDNPFFSLNNAGNTSELGRFIGNVNVDYNPVDWLRVQYTLGSDFYNDSRVESLPFTSSSNPIGQVTRFDNNNREIDYNLVATANRDFNPNFSGSITLGQNLNSRRYRQQYSQGQGLVAPSPFVLQNTLSVSPPNEFRSTRHIEAYFGQVEADLYNQLFITAGLRNDGFSTFGESDPRANYPKASVAWAFTNALGNTDQRGPLSFGKLRFSYGETGREPPVYATITALNITSQFGSGFGDVINISQSGQGGIVSDFTLGNTDLRPERNKESEYGIDLGFFDQRADLGFTYYDKKSTDVILAVPVNTAATGFSTQLANAAEIRNQGIEITFNARPVTRENFALDLGFQFGRNRGNVESLAGAQFVPYNSEGFTGAIGSSTVGYAPGVIRGNDFLRCGLSNGDAEVTDAGGTLGEACAGARRGSIYIDESGLPVVDPDERVIADPNPRYTAGVNASMSFLRNFRVSGLLDIRRGSQVWNGTRGILYNFGTHGDTERLREQTGTYAQFFGDQYEGTVGPGVDEVAFASMTDWENWFRGNGGGFGLASAQFIEDGSFVKLREVSLTYTLNRSFLRNAIGFTSADLRLAGRNLKTWTDYTGLDPEANLGGAEFLTQGLDYFNNPQTRSFVLSVTLNR